MTALFTEASPADAYACTVAGLTATHPDGRTASLDNCVWMQVHPCGCVSGVTKTVIGDEALLTADAALRSMSETAAEHREDVKNGVRMVCVLWDDYRGEAGDLFKTKCPHDPEYGVARQTREVDGLKWTRISPTRWSLTVDGKHWSLDHWSKLWHLGGPFQGNGRYRSPYVGRKIADAIVAASAYVLAHPEGLEHAS